MNKNNQISTRYIAIILFNDSIRYTLLLRAIIDKYPETFFMNSVIKMRSNRGYFAREEIRFPAVISIDRPERVGYDVEISENTANVKQNASLPARASLSCFKALTFSYFNI